MPNLQVENNKAEYTVQEKNGLTYFEYEKEVSGKNYKYFACAFKADDAYWLIHFYCETKNYDDLSETFVKWAKTVTFDK